MQRRPEWRAGRFAGVVLAAIVLGLPGMAPAAQAREPTVFPLPIGRAATPAGRIKPLEAFPTGLAASPDGKTLLVIAGPPLEIGGPGETVTLAVVDATTRRTRQVIHVADAFQSIVFSPSGRYAYVAGGNDHTVHVLRATHGGRFKLLPDIPVDDFAAGLAVSREGHTLWVSQPQLSEVVRVSLPEGEILTRIPARTPDQLALSADGATLYASDWRANVITEIATSGGTKTREIHTGKHPQGIAVASGSDTTTTPSAQSRTRLLVANSNDASVAVVDPRTRRSGRVNLAQLAGRNDSPSAIAVAPNGRSAYVTLAGDDAVAVLRYAGRRKPPWRLAGLIPTGWYPTAVALSADGRTLHVVTARGVARSRRATRPYRAIDPARGPDGAAATVGTLESLPVPNSRTLKRYTAAVRRTLEKPVLHEHNSRNPIVAGRAGPIKHIIYITRENKTYDADLGDLHPGPGKKLVVFGQPITPNLHRLERQFIESQNFMYQGFASAVGHMWEDAGTTTDSYERAVAFGMVADIPHISEAWRDRANIPPAGTLADQALRAGRTIRTYAMDTAEFARLIPPSVQASPTLYPRYDIHIADAKREAGWESEFHQFAMHQCAGALATTYGAHCNLPDFEYVYFGNDHTTTVNQPGYAPIEAQVADNDYATGKVIDTVSHSPYWASTLVIVVEDDPQGTGDHISPYRGLLAMASPWVKRGFISHAPYNLASVVAAIDRILGLPPLSDFAATSRPLDDLFASSPRMAPFSVDGSGVAAHPFVPLPGPSPKADVRHGVYSFSSPDATNPAVAGLATWRQMKGPSAPASVSAP